jgi:Cytochrome c554 and c-prime
MQRQIIVCVAKQIWVALLALCVAQSLAGQRATPAHSAGANSATEAARQNFVGDSACKECHGAIAETYLHTTHHLTSQLPTKDSISGSFASNGNVLKTGNPDLHFLMEARGGSFYQTAVFWQPPDQKMRSERMDFVTGSGEKGQTYLYWRGNQLFQLPVSYWTDLHAWVNSPGFTDGVADFNRRIVPRCLECHATYFASEPSDKAENFYRKSGFVLGISCERCHGPGREHVRQKRLAGTSDFAGKSAMVNPASLTRERQMEICAQCHGGIGESLEPAFSYVPGQPLEKYIKLQRPDEDARVDVHGNQVALTQRSRCYQSSQMTCTTCHDVHAAERPAAAYSEKCLQCHKDKDCGEFAKLGPKIRENCVDCHMPVQDSNLIISNVAEKQIKAQMRSHWIKVYPAPQAN